MAEIVQSLFGMTPESYQQQQAQQADARALQYAKLNPYEQANYAIGRGAYSLAGALGGQDPQLQMISARQAIAKQINYADPDSIATGVKALSESGDTQGAMMLADVLNKARSEQALTAQRTAAATRESSGAIPSDIQVGRELTRLENDRQAITTLPDSPEKTESLRRIDSGISNLKLLAVKTPAGPGFGSQAERYAKSMFDGKTYAQLTPSQAEAVNKRVEEEEGKKAEKGAVKVYPPGTPVAQKDWMDFTQKVLSNDPVMTRTSTIISDAPNAIDIIRTSETNDISAAALPGALARLTGEGKNMSNQDVARFARSGGLEDRLVQDAVKFFTGRTTSVKKEQAEQFATALYRGALLQRRKKLSDEAAQYGYTETPNYKIALSQIDEQLAQIKAPGAAAPAISAADQALLDKYPSKAK